MEADAEAGQSACDECGEEDAERESEGGADESGDDALVADHPPHLASGHADCAQHAELAGAFEDGEHECVDDPEQADDDRECEQDVEEIERVAGDRSLKGVCSAIGWRRGSENRGTRPLVRATGVVRARIREQAGLGPCGSSDLTLGAEVGAMSHVGEDVLDSCLPNGYIPPHVYG